MARFTTLVSLMMMGSQKLAAVLCFHWKLISRARHQPLTLVSWLHRFQCTSATIRSYWNSYLCPCYTDKADIVDEAITFFRANVFFKNFHVKSSADKLLIYLTFYINIALKRLEGCRTLAVGTKAIINLGLEKVPVPGEPGFPFPGLFTLPQSQEEAGIHFRLQLYAHFFSRLVFSMYKSNMLIIILT